MRSRSVFITFKLKGSSTFNNDLRAVFAISLPINVLSEGNFTELIRYCVRGETLYVISAFLFLETVS